MCVLWNSIQPFNNRWGFNKVPSNSVWYITILSLYTHEYRTIITYNTTHNLHTRNNKRLTFGIVDDAVDLPSIGNKSERWPPPPPETYRLG